MNFVRIWTLLAFRCLCFLVITLVISPRSFAEPINLKSAPIDWTRLQDPDSPAAATYAQDLHRKYCEDDRIHAEISPDWGPENCYKRQFLSELYLFDTTQKCSALSQRQNVLCSESAAAILSIVGSRLKSHVDDYAMIGLALIPSTRTASYVFRSALPEVSDALVNTTKAGLKRERFRVSQCEPGLASYLEANPQEETEFLKLVDVDWTTPDERCAATTIPTISRENVGRILALPDASRKTIMENNPAVCHVLLKQKKAINQRQACFYLKEVFITRRFRFDYNQHVGQCAAPGKFSVQTHTTKGDLNSTMERIKNKTDSDRERIVKVTGDLFTAAELKELKIPANKNTTTAAVNYFEIQVPAKSRFSFDNEKPSGNSLPAFSPMAALNHAGGSSLLTLGEFPESCPHLNMSDINESLANPSPKNRKRLDAEIKCRMIGNMNATLGRVEFLPGFKECDVIPPDNAQLRKDQEIDQKLAIEADRMLLQASPANNSAYKKFQKNLYEIPAKVDHLRNSTGYE